MGSDVYLSCKIQRKHSRLLMYSIRLSILTIHMQVYFYLPLNGTMDDSKDILSFSGRKVNKIKGLCIVKDMHVGNHSYWI